MIAADKESSSASCNIQTGLTVSVDEILHSDEWWCDDVQQELRELDAESSPKQSTSGAAGDTNSDGAAKGLFM